MERILPAVPDLRHEEWGGRYSDEGSVSMVFRTEGTNHRVTVPIMVIPP